MANDFQYGGWNCYTLQCGMIMTLISTGDCTRPMAAPCSVIRGSGMTCHWIRPMAAPCNVRHGSGIMALNSPVGSNMHSGRWLCPNVRHIRILHLVSISIMSPQKQLSADMQYIIPTNQACKIVVTHVRYINRAFALHCYHRMPS